MQIVGRFIRLGADFRRDHPVDRPVEPLQRHLAQLLREALLKRRVEETPERQRTRHLILPQPRLRFMECVRGPLRQRRPVERRIDSLLVQRVAALVHRAQQTGDRQLRMHRRGDPHVGQAETGGKGMHRQVEPPPFEIIAELFDHLAGERQLARAVELLVQKSVVRRTVRQLPHQSGLLAAQRLENPVQLGGGHAGFIIIQQRIVDARRRREKLRIAAFQLHDPRQMRSEQCIVRRLPRPDPRRMGLRRGPGQLRHQLRRNLVLLREVAPQPGQQRPFRRILRIVRRFQRLDQPSQLRGGGFRVDHSGQRLDLRRPAVFGAGGQIDLLVPFQQRQSGFQVMNFSDQRFQFRKLLLHSFLHPFAFPVNLYSNFTAFPRSRIPPIDSPQSIINPPGFEIFAQQKARNCTRRRHLAGRGDRGAKRTRPPEANRRGSLPF